MTVKISLEQNVTCKTDHCWNDYGEDNTYLLDYNYECFIKLLCIYMTLEPLYLLWIYTIALPNYSGFKCLIKDSLSGLSIYLSIYISSIYLPKCLFLICFFPASIYNVFLCLIRIYHDILPLLLLGKCDRGCTWAVISLNPNYLQQWDSSYTLCKMIIQTKHKLKQISKHYCC